MEVAQTEQGVLIQNPDCFSPALTLECGQAFRWVLTPEGWRGTAFGRQITVSETSRGILLRGADMESFDTVWRSYFDLDTDYGALCSRFCEDETMRLAVSRYPGIRVLRQQPWEALCSFIISQNNNIPRIKGIIARLCADFGQELAGGGYAFPDPQVLCSLTPEDLAPLRAGFRAKYIIDAAQRVTSGEVRLSELRDMPLEEGCEQLMKIKGVGPKVAQCTLLYGCGKTDAFPVDVWVRRVMEEIYPDGLPECLREHRGIAQQYLFHWRRMADSGIGQ